MPITIKLLGEGQLPAAAGDLYEVPAATTAIIKTITLVNTHTTAEVVNLYILKAGSTARRIIPKDLSLGASYSLVFDDEITLEAADKIQGDTTTAVKVDFTIMGVEKT